MKRLLGCLLFIAIGLAVGCQTNGDKQEVKNVMEATNTQVKTATLPAAGRQVYPKPDEGSLKKKLTPL